MALTATSLTTPLLWHTPVTAQPTTHPLSCAILALPHPYADHLRAPSPIRHIPTSVNAQRAKPGRCDHDPTANHHDRNDNEGVLGPQYHSYDCPNLARPHGSVN